jgi:hypothetical protein
MDPSAFNSNRLSNADKSLDDWKRNKRRGPRSPWGPVIVLVIIITGIVLIFHRVL